jgi:hypothetical protein
VWDACSGIENQHWIIRSHGSIQLGSSTLVLDDTASTTNSTQATVSGYNGTAQQLWTLP